MLTIASVALILSGFATLVGREKINATGIFCVYFVIGVIVPFLSGIYQPDQSDQFSYFLSSPETPVAFLYLSLAFFLTLASSRISFARSNKASICWKMEPNNILASQLARLAIVFGILALIGTVAGQGGFQNAYEAAFLRARREGSSLLNFLAFPFWGAIVFATLAWYIADGTTASLHVRAWVMTAVAVCAAICFLNGGRSVFILFVLSLSVRTVLSRSKKHLLLFTAVGLPFIAFFSYLMIMLRYTAQDAQALNRTDFGIFSLATTGLAYLDHFVISMQYAEYAGHDGGTLYFNAALSFIPRSLWHDKPFETAIQLRNFLFGDTTGGIPPGLFGEGYIAAGVFGVITISIIYGALLGLIDSTTRKGSLISSPFHCMIAGIFLPLIGFTLVRGGVELSVFRIGIPCAMSVFAWRYAARRCSFSCYFVTPSTGLTHTDQPIVLETTSSFILSTQHPASRMSHTT